MVKLLIAKPFHRLMSPLLLAGMGVGVSVVAGDVFGDVEGVVLVAVVVVEVSVEVEDRVGVVIVARWQVTVSKTKVTL